MNTQVFEASAPVPDSVGIAILYTPGFFTLSQPTYFEHLPLFLSKIDIAFDMSNILPPPTPTMQSIFFFK